MLMRSYLALFVVSALSANALGTGQKFDLKGIEEYIKWRKRETEVLIAANHAKVLHNLSPIEELAWHMPKELLARQDKALHSLSQDESASEEDSEEEEDDQDGVSLAELLPIEKDGFIADLDDDEAEDYTSDSTDLSDLDEPSYSEDDLPTDLED